MRNIEGKIRSYEDAKYYSERRLPKAIFQMIGGGGGPGISARLNEEAFENVLFRPPAGIHTKNRTAATKVFGHDIRIPVILTSIGSLGIGHHDGEIAATRAAGAAGTIQYVSGVANARMEDIMRAATGPVYQQLYYIGSRDASASIVERARDLGAAGIVICVESAAPAYGPDILAPDRGYVPTGVSVKDAVRFLPQIWNKPAWVRDFVLKGHMQMPVAANARYPDGRPMAFYEAASQVYDETPVWEDIAWIREIWDCQIIVKGVMTVESARKAVDFGADGLVVSNHGGSMFDGAMPSLRALPAIVEAVGDQIDVTIDGGVRRGSDVVKALAMGAKAVSIGRPYVHALMAAGEPGVHHMLNLFRDQILRTLGWLGVSSVDELDPSMLEFPAYWATLTYEDLLARSRTQDVDSLPSSDRHRTDAGRS